MNSTKSFNYLFYPILLALAFLFQNNAWGVKLQIHPNIQIIADANNDILDLSEILHDQVSRNADPIIIPEQQTQQFSDMDEVKTFYNWLAADPSIIEIQDTKNTILPKILRVNRPDITPADAENKNYIKENANIIAFKDGLDLAIICSFLKIACILEFVLPIKQALAKALAIEYYHNRNLENFSMLSTLAQSYVRYEYLMIFDEFFDTSRQFEVSTFNPTKENSEIGLIILHLMREHILPGDPTKIAWPNIASATFKNDLARILARTFYSQLRLFTKAMRVLATPKNWILRQQVEETYLQFKDEWLELLPKNIRDKTKIQYWIVSGKPLSPGGKPFTFDSLDADDWRTLVAAGKIPKIVRVNLQRQNSSALVAEEYVFNNRTSYFVSKDRKSTDTFKTMPENFRVAFARSYRCKCLEDGIDAWLDGQEIYVPVSYLRTYKLAQLKSNATPWRPLDITETNIETISKDLEHLINTSNKERILEIMQRQPLAAKIFDKFKKTYPMQTLEIKTRKFITEIEMGDFNNKQLKNIDAELFNNLTPEQQAEILQNILNDLYEENVKDFYKSVFTTGGPHPILNEDELRIFYEYVTQRLVEMNEVQKKVAWAWANTTPKEPLKSLSVLEWQYLAEHGKIPAARDFTNLKQLAQEYVERLSSTFTLKHGFSLTDATEPTKLAGWLRALPVEFQSMVQQERAIRGLTQENVDIPVLELITRGKLPLPAGQTIASLRASEVRIPEFYAQKLNTMDEEAAKPLLEKLALSPSTLSSIFVEYMRLPNRKESTTKLLQDQISKLPNFALPLGTLVAEERERNKIFQNKVLDLSKWPITSVKKEDFGHFATAIKLVISNTLIKELPEAVFDDLVNLQEIVISNNPNLVTLPASLFAQQIHLRTLTISENSELVPDTGLFAGLNHNVTLLDLSKNKLDAESLPDLSGLNVFTLKLNDNQLKTIPTMPSKANLVELHLQNNQLSDALLSVALKDCPALLYLDLSNNQIKSFATLANLGFPKLAHLFLASNEGLSLEGVQKTMPALQTTDISNCGITNFTEPFFKALPTVKILFANGNSLEGLIKFPRHSSLQELYLGQCGIEDIPDNTFKDLTSLRILSLEGNAITMPNENSFKGLTKLEKLYLFCNQIQGLPDNALQGLTSLKALDLSFNQLSTLNNDPDHQPLIFIYVTQLESLNLSFNQINQITGYTFSPLTSLKYLNLENNGIKKIDFRAFYGLPGSMKINFRGNNAIGISKLVSSWNASLTGGFTPLTTSLETEWYNRTPILSPLLVGAGIAGGVATFALLPAAAPAYLAYAAYSAAGAAGAAGMLGSTVRTLKSSWSRVVSIFRETGLPRYEFKTDIQWPKGNPQQKNLREVKTYWSSISKEYSDIVRSKKTEIIRIGEIVRR